MTPYNDMTDGDRAAERGVDDRIFDHHRQQLSALLDGELPPDEARFLLRRLQHDPELLGCWTRWQQAGDCLRKRVELPVAGSFALGVAQAVAREPKLVAASSSGRHRLRWAGGAAIAASAAVLALMLARQAPQASPDASPVSPRVATAPAPSPTPAPVAPTPERAPAVAAELATALAVADVPRRIGAARRSRGQSQRAALRAPVQSQQVATAQADTAIASNTAAVDPFSGQHISLTDRPWPRALLPATPATGSSFNVDYGVRRAVTPGLYPFAPRNAGDPPASDARP